MGLFDFTEETHLAAAGKLPGTELDPDGKARKRVRIQVFRNDFLERWFGTAHPATPGLWLPVAGLGIYLGVAGPLGPAWTAVLVAAGITLVTLIEYFLHRFLFHMVPKNHEDQLQHFLLHGYHHDFPNDPKRLVLPPIMILPVAVVVGTVYFFVFGAYFWPVYGGTALGYIAYEWVHYYTHHFNPKAGMGKWLKRYHIMHHFDSPHHRFGISSPLWDLVLGGYMPLNQSWRKMQKQAREAAEAELGDGPAEAKA